MATREKHEITETLPQDTAEAELSPPPSPPRADDFAPGPDVQKVPEPTERAVQTPQTKTNKESEQQQQQQQQNSSSPSAAATTTTYQGYPPIASETRVAPTWTTAGPPPVTQQDQYPLYAQAVPSSSSSPPPPHFTYSYLLSLRDPAVTGNDLDSLCSDRGPSRSTHRRRSRHRRRKHVHEHQPRGKNAGQYLRPTAPSLSAVSSSVSDLSSASGDGETDWIESDESEVASEAAAYRSTQRYRANTKKSAKHNQTRGGIRQQSRTNIATESESDPMQDIADADDALYYARKNGGVVGVCKELQVEDFFCPHCGEDPQLSRTAVVVYPCCNRKAHYSCVARKRNPHRLASEGVEACMQCLRPDGLLFFEQVLERYAPHVPSEQPSDSSRADPEPSASSPQYRERLWKSYTALQAHLKKEGFLKGVGSFLKSEDRTKPPEMDWEAAVKHGVDIQTLLGAGWSLATIAKEFRMQGFDDPDWQTKLGLDRNAFLELSFPDMWWFMNEYRPHPYALRKHFGIERKHLWYSAARRRSSGYGSSTGSRCRSPVELSGAPRQNGNASAELATALQQRMKSQQLVDQSQQAVGPERGFQTTQVICKHYGVLSPRQLATLGFDLHHMILMGFNKDHFANFPHFTMDDWITHLGFRKPHWTLLGLTREDFSSPRGVLSKLHGWRLQVLMRRWRATPTQLYQLGIISDGELELLLQTPPLSLHWPVHSAQPYVHPHAWGHGMPVYPVGPGPSPSPHVRFPSTMQGGRTPPRQPQHVWYYRHQSIPPDHPVPNCMQGVPRLPGHNGMLRRHPPGTPGTTGNTQPPQRPRAKIQRKSLRRDNNKATGRGSSRNLDHEYGIP